MTTLLTSPTAQIGPECQDVRTLSPVSQPQTSRGQNTQTSLMMSLYTVHN